MNQGDPSVERMGQLVHGDDWPKVRRRARWERIGHVIGQLLGWTIVIALCAAMWFGIIAAFKAVF